MTIEEMIKEFRRPYPADRTEWKIQASTKTGGALIVGYIDARDVSERLNKVCPDMWSCSFNPIVVNSEVIGVQCQISINNGERAIRREDAGIGELEDNVNAGIKTLYSDAFKRAAVHFGINSCMYELPQIWAKPENLKDGKYLKDEYKDKLRNSYKSWVQKDEIIERFGEVYS